MKRWRPPRPLILIALLLFAGAVVNVAAAWGIAAALRPSRFEWGAMSMPWILPVPDEWPHSADVGAGTGRACWSFAVQWA